MKKVNGIRGDVFRVMIGKTIRLIVSMISSICVSRALLSSGKGEFAVMTSIAGVYAQFCNFGLHSAHTYYVSRDNSKTSLIRGNIILAFVFSVILSLISYPILVYFKSLLKITNFLITVSLITFILNLFLLLQENLSIAIGKIEKYNFIQIIPPTFTVLAILLVSKFLLVDVYMVAIISVVALFLSLIYSLFGISTDKPIISVKYLVSVLPYGFKSYFACLSTYLLLRSDIFMLNYFLEKEEVGVYSLAVNLTDMLYVFSSAVSAVLFPKLSQQYDVKQKTKLLRKIMLVMFPIVLIMSVAFGVISGTLVPLLYGKSFIDSVSLIRLLIVASIAWSYSGCAFNFFASENRFSESIIVPLVAFACNILLNYWLIPQIGTCGAAIASDVSYTLMTVIMYICMYRYLKKHR